ncbi:MAG: hypothetical protein EB015_07805 [Methylocystaceae bacterium]|nr:hypothetical protein [Methylocystaceae bacterium]
MISSLLTKIIIKVQSIFHLANENACDEETTIAAFSLAICAYIYKLKAERSSFIACKDSMRKWEDSHFELSAAVTFTHARFVSSHGLYTKA